MLSILLHCWCLYHTPTYNIAWLLMIYPVRYLFCTGRTGLGLILPLWNDIVTFIMWHSRAAVWHVSYGNAAYGVQLQAISRCTHAIIFKWLHALYILDNGLKHRYHLKKRAHMLKSVEYPIQCNFSDTTIQQCLRKYILFLCFDLNTR